MSFQDLAMCQKTISRHGSSLCEHERDIVPIQKKCFFRPYVKVAQDNLFMVIDVID